MPGVAGRIPDRSAQWSRRLYQTKPGTPSFLPRTCSAHSPSSKAGRFAKSTRNLPAKAEQPGACSHVGDDEVRRTIMRTLDELGLRENTLVVFTSDNGGEIGDHQRPLRASRRFMKAVYASRDAAPARIKPGTTEATPLSPSTTTQHFARRACVVTGDRRLTASASHALQRKRQASARYSTGITRSPPHFLGGRSTGVIRHGDFKLIYDTARWSFTTCATISVSNVTCARDARHRTAPDVRRMAEAGNRPDA